MFLDCCSNKNRLTLPENHIVIFVPWYRGAICVVLTVYHDLNVCYNGRQMPNNKKNFRIKVATIFTYVTDFDNEQKHTSAS